MRTHKVFGRAVAFAAAAFVAIALASGAVLAASASSPAAQEYVGKWRTLDTQGEPMQILLTSDGVARGMRPGEALAGKWKVRRDSAVIRWSTGWTTRIIQTDDGYAKLAYAKGQRWRLRGKPLHAAEAEKVY